MKNKVELYIAQLNHPLKNEFLALRSAIVAHFPNATEIFKWNAPSYQLNGIDFLTFNLSKPSEIRLIFHRGATVKEQLKERFIDDQSDLLTWIANDRAIVTFNDLLSIENKKEALLLIIEKWMHKI